ncbi:hypothetical protein BGX26_003996, partial [Mortierella sp. AD094]
MSLSIFDISLIKDVVTQYLDRHELARCVLVSKEWSAWFSPVLWRTVYFQGRPATTMEALEQNRDRAR